MGMTITTHTETLRTKGQDDCVDVTGAVQGAVSRSKVRQGLATVFVTGSTAGVTTVEYEPGLVQDLEELFDRIAPAEARYHHEERWHDGNGHSHVRASLLGPSLVVPFAKGKLLLGTWQQVILIDFDNRPRTRELVVTLMGE